MYVSVSGTIDQNAYQKKFRGASAPLDPLDPPMDIHERDHYHFLTFFWLLASGPIGWPVAPFR